MNIKQIFKQQLQQLKAHIFGKKVIVYPSYGYPNAKDNKMWVVPMRVWVHDNRDTPFVEGALERLAIGHFEDDLERQLADHERAQLRACLEGFIADDKSDESVTFTFADDTNNTLFQFAQRTNVCSGPQKLDT